MNRIKLRCTGCEYKCIVDITPELEYGFKHCIEQGEHEFDANWVNVTESNETVQNLINSLKELESIGLLKPFLAENKETFDAVREFLK